MDEIISFCASVKTLFVKHKSSVGCFSFKIPFYLYFFPMMDAVEDGQFGEDGGDVELTELSGDGEYNDLLHTDERDDEDDAGGDADRMLETTRSPQSPLSAVDAAAFKQKIYGETGPSEAAKSLSSDAETFVNTFISFIGAGILGLPYSVRQSGMLLSAIIIIAVAIVSLYCMWLLLECQRLLESRGILVDSYGKIGQHAVGAKWMVVVDSSIIITQTGFGIGYLVFIGKNMYAMFMFDRTTVIMFLLPGLLGLVMIRQFKYLAPFSLLANTCTAFGISCVLYSDFEFMALNDEKGDLEWFIFRQIPYMFGVAVYCFEGMALVIPLKMAAAKKSHFLPILSTVVCCYAALCIFFGICGFLAFGHDTADIITLNISEGSLQKMVKVALCIALYFTYPVMILPVSKIFDTSLSAASAKSGGSPTFLKIKQNLHRFVLVASTGMIAIVIPNFTDFMSLIGSSCCSFLALVFPPVFYIGVVSW
jgi:proton-coupled amino acid transporter